MNTSAKPIKICLEKPTTILDAGKVKIGGQGPIFSSPSKIGDSGKVRVGGQSPIFR